jgi:hypothetical protein
MLRPPVRLEVEVAGLGPFFLLRVTLTNLDPTKALAKVSLALTCDSSAYRLAKHIVHLPLLVPGLAYVADIQVECRDAAAPPGLKSGDVSILVLAPGLVPLASAVVTMPQSELLE